MYTYTIHETSKKQIRRESRENKYDTAVVVARTREKKQKIKGGSFCGRLGRYQLPCNFVILAVCIPTRSFGGVSNDPTYLKAGAYFFLYHFCATTVY